MDDRLDVVAKNAAQQGRSTRTAGEASEEDVSMASSATSTSVQMKKSKTHGGAANRSIEAAPAKKIKRNMLPELVMTLHPNDVGIRGTTAGHSRVEEEEKESADSNC